MTRRAPERAKTRRSRLYMSVLAYMTLEPSAQLLNKDDF